jgi:hypothetical protein
MKLTKETLKRIIKEELDAVLEAHLNKHGQKQNRSRIVTKDRQPAISIMDLRSAKAQLGLDKEKSWAVLSEPENVYIKKKIEALAQRLYDSSTATSGGEDFKKVKKGEYDTLIAAIEAAGGTFTPTIPDEKKGEQEDG